MFKTPKELQEFLIWAQEHKIRELKVGNIEVTFSDLAFLPADPFADEADLAASEQKLTDLVKQRDKKVEDDELLYWST